MLVIAIDRKLHTTVGQRCDLVCYTGSKGDRSKDVTFESYGSVLSSPHWHKLGEQVQDRYAVSLASDIERLEELLTDKRRLAREAMVTY